jgi:hypothetical protein
MENLGLITKVGPVTSEPKVSLGAKGSIPFRIEALMGGNPVVLSLSRDAAEELAEELARYLQARRSR